MDFAETPQAETSWQTVGNRVASGEPHGVSRSHYRTHSKNDRLFNLSFLLVGGGGFEPPKSETSDLQSDAFGHSANRPYVLNFKPLLISGAVGQSGAGDWNRTRNLLITNQLLCQLSYTSKTA